MQHPGRVPCSHCGRSNSLAVSASSDGSVIIWDLETKTRALCLFESTMFKSLCYHPDESQLLTTGSDRKITYWDTFDGQAIRVLEGSEEGELTSLAISNSGSHLVSGGEDRLLKLWDYDEGLCKFVGVGHSGTIACCAMSPDQSTIVSVGQDGAIFIWGVPEDIQERCREPAEASAGA